MSYKNYVPHPYFISQGITLLLICFKNLPLGKLVISTYPCEVRSWHRLPRWYSSAVAKAVHCIRFCAKGTKIWVRERRKMFIRQLFASNLSQEWHFPFTHSLLWNHCHAVHLVYRYLWGYLLPVKRNSKSQTEIKQGDMSKLHQKTVIEPQSEPFLPECQSDALTVELHLLLLSHPTVYNILGWPLKSKARHPQYQL